jgi:hypothetical protein
MAPIIELPLLQTTDSTLVLANLPSKQPSVNVTSIPTTPDTPTKDTHEPNTLVLNPAFITQDFNLLRFHAAAFDQLPSSNFSPDFKDQAPQPPTSPALSTSLISSPYNNPGHYLDLLTLPTPSLLLALALTALKPLCADYATTAYTSALNFDHVLHVLQNLASRQNPGFTWPETSFYVVVFRSQLKQGIDEEWLYKLDYESHREACESGGLLKYWFGKASGERRNLATCKL